MWRACVKNIMSDVESAVESRFMRRAYNAYIGVLRKLVNEGGVWNLKKGIMVVASLIGDRPIELSFEEYVKAAGGVILNFNVHIDAVDGFRKNRSLSAKTVASFVSEFRIRGYLQHDPFYGVFLFDGMVVNDSGVTVVERSGVFRESVCEFENAELSIVVIGGNHRAKALKSLGSDVDLGCEDLELDRHLAAMYMRGRSHNGYFPMRIISCPPEISGLVEWASLDNMKNNVSRFD